jgi:hypothetical protein
MMQSPETQHALFVDAVQLLGGSRSAARALAISERTMANLLAGKQRLHDGFLRDMARALLDHAEGCRALERRLNPLFAANRTEGQPREDRRRTGSRWRAPEGEA